MVVIGGPHRADDSDIVDHAAQVRPPVTDFDAALPPLGEADLHWVDGLHQLACGGGELYDVVLEPVRFENVSVRRVGDGLAGVLVQLRLGVEALEVAGAALHEEPDDALGLGGEVRQARGRRPGGGLVGGGRAPDAVALEHGAEGQTGKAHAEVREEGPAVDASAGTGRGDSGLFHGRSVLQFRVAPVGTACRAPISSLAYHHKLVAIKQDMHQILAGAQSGIGRSGYRALLGRAKACQSRWVAEQGGLALEEVPCL